MALNLHFPLSWPKPERENKRPPSSKLSRVGRRENRIEYNFHFPLAVSVCAFPNPTSGPSKYLLYQNLTVVDSRFIFVLSLGGRCSLAGAKVRAHKRKTEDTNLQNAV